MCFASTESVVRIYLVLNRIEKEIERAITQRLECIIDNDEVSSSNLLSPKKNRIEKEKKKKEYLKEGKGREKNDWRE